MALKINFCSIFDCPGTQYTWEAIDQVTANFTPDITPLVLAGAFVVVVFVDVFAVCDPNAVVVLVINVVI